MRFGVASLRRLCFKSVDDGVSFTHFFGVFGSQRVVVKYRRLEGTAGAIVRDEQARGKHTNTARD